MPQTRVSPCPDRRCIKHVCNQLEDEFLFCVRIKYPLYKDIRKREHLAYGHIQTYLSVQILLSDNAEIVFYTFYLSWTVGCI